VQGWLGKFEAFSSSTTTILILPSPDIFIGVFASGKDPLVGDPTHHTDQFFGGNKFRINSGVQRDLESHLQVCEGYISALQYTPTLDFQRRNEIPIRP
jgi:hypothetical protein